MIHDFNYVRATSVQEALESLENYQEDYKIICGGQSLLILMRQGLVAPEYLIDIKRVEDLNYITFDEQNGLRIGATTTHRTIEKSPVVRDHYPSLVDMEENLASIQTRTWGTIGGNLAHGDPAGCPAPLLIALNATVKIASKSGERIVSVEDFSLDYFETDLREGEMLLEIQVPPMPTRSAARYEKFNIIKNDQGFVSVAAAVTVDEEGAACQDVRIVLGAAGPVPLRARKTEKLLRGKGIDDKLLTKAGIKAAEEADPVADIHASEAYRRALVNTLTRRMVRKAWEQAKRRLREEG